MLTLPLPCSVDAPAVLLVEDQPLLLRLEALTLSRAGLRVLQAADAFQALDLIRQHRERIGLAVLDRHLPGLDGVTLLARLRQVQPDLPCLLVSGADREEVLPAECAFLAKPFYPAQLLAVVRDLLAVPV
jgi:DNA-binding response OmpR family regulator